MTERTDLPPKIDTAAVLSVAMEELKKADWDKGKAIKSMMDRMTDNPALLEDLWFTIFHFGIDKAMEIVGRVKPKNRVEVV